MADSAAVDEPDDSEEAGIAALCAEGARRRADALAAALASPAMDDADASWAADAADSLARLAVHAGADGDALAEVAARAAGLAGLRADARRDAAAGLLGRLDELRATLPASPAPPPPGAAGLPLGAIVGALRADVRRAADERGASVAIDVSTPEAVHVPRPVAGALVDALGRVVRDSVAFGTPRGGAIRVVTHVERDVLVIVVGDRGSGTPGGSPGAALAGERRAGLHAAAGCLAAVGGELTAGAGPWGGASITVRVPLDG